MIHEATVELKKIMAAGPRQVVSEKTEDGGSVTMSPVNSDLEAAKAVLKAGLDLRKL